MKQRVKYIQACIKKIATRKGVICPSCQHTISIIVSRKFLITALRRCQNCQLLFRTPTETAEENTSFYQENYAEGFTTDCPSDEQLAKLLNDKFENSERDYSSIVDIIRAAGGANGNSLFDFGCSWGYGSWQLIQEGFSVESFEISVPRANYARSKLGIKVHSSLSDVQGSIDIYFSSHVLEHVTSVREAIDFGMRILKPGGLFVAFTPNGSQAFREMRGKAWNKLWGMVHPNFLDDRYYSTIFSEQNFRLFSNPYQIIEIENWHIGQASDRFSNQLNGNELLLLARK